MNEYRHTLTDIEIQCGVTLEQVEDVRRRCLVRQTTIVMPIDTPPALAHSVARYAFGGRSTQYLGHNALGLAVYGLSQGDTPHEPWYNIQDYMEEAEQ